MRRVLLLVVVLITIFLASCNERAVFEVEKNNQSLQGSEPSQELLTLTADEKLLLAKFVEAEANNESYVGRVALASLVLNRIKNPNFPNDVANVIAQFHKNTSVLSGEINVSETTNRSVQDAINGLDPSEGALYYSKTENNSPELKAIKKIGNITFFKYP